MIFISLVFVIACKSTETTNKAGNQGLIQADSIQLTQLTLIQGDWKNSGDDKALVQVRQNRWKFLYDNENGSEVYLIHWKSKLPQYVDTTVQTSFVLLTNRTDTLFYGLLGVTDSTLSLMHFPSGQIHLYLKSK